MKKGLALILSIVMLFSVMAVVAIADNSDIAFTLSLDKSSYKPGDIAELTLSVSGIENVDEAIGAFVIQLSTPKNTFKADVYTQADVDANPLLSGSLGLVKTSGYAKGSSLVNQKDLSISNPEDGVIRMVYVYADVIDAIQEDGTIGTLYLDVLEDAVGGEVEFDVDEMSVRNAMNTADLTASTTGVSFTIGSDVTEAPTTEAPTTQAPTDAPVSSGVMIQDFNAITSVPSNFITAQGASATITDTYSVSGNALKVSEPSPSTWPYLKITGLTAPANATAIKFWAARSAYVGLDIRLRSTGSSTNILNPKFTEFKNISAGGGFITVDLTTLSDENKAKINDIMIVFTGNSQAVDIYFDDFQWVVEGDEPATEAPTTEAPTDAPTEAPTEAPVVENIPYTFDNSTTVPANIGSIRNQATSLTVEPDAAGGNELKIVTPSTATGIEILNVSAPADAIGFKFDARTEGVNAQLNVRFYTPTNLNTNVIATTSEQTFEIKFEGTLANAKDVQYIWIQVQKAVTAYFDNFQWIYASEEEPTTEAPTTEAPTEAPTDAPTDAPTQAPTQAPTDAPVSGGLMIEDFNDDATVPAGFETINGASAAISDAYAASGNALKLSQSNASTFPSVKIKNLTPPANAVGFKFWAIRSSYVAAELKFRSSTDASGSNLFSKNIYEIPYTSSGNGGYITVDIPAEYRSSVKSIMFTLKDNGTNAIDFYIDDVQWVIEGDEPETDEPTEAPTTVPGTGEDGGEYPALDGYKVKDVISTFDEYTSSDEKLIVGTSAYGTAWNKNSFGMVNRQYNEAIINATLSGLDKADGFRFWYKSEGTVAMNLKKNYSSSQYSYALPANAEGGWITILFSDMKAIDNAMALSEINKIAFMPQTNGQFFVDEIHTIVSTAADYTEDLVITANNNDTITVSVNNANPNRTYQIWAWQNVANNATGEQKMRWVMQGDTTATYTPTAVDGVYKAMVMVIENGETVDTKFGEAISFTDVKAGKAKINAVSLNGKTTDKYYVDLADASTTALTLKVDTTNVDLIKVYTGTGVEVADNGELQVDFTDYAPGAYTFKIVASNDTTTDTYKVYVWVYGAAFDKAPVVATGVESTATDNVFTVTALTDAADCWFTVGSRQVNGKTVTITYEVGKYGIYDVYGYLKSSLNASYYDDVVYTKHIYKRPGVEFKVVPNTTYGDGDATFTLGETLRFDASAIVTGDYDGELQYQFYRNDARGWVVVKDWSTDGTYEWTPAFAGNYIYQIRVKGEGAGSYEAFNTVVVNVEGDKAQGTLSLNSITATKRTPVELKATLTGGAAEDLMQYRFRVTDKANNVSEIIKAYSPEASCVWVPRKAGTFDIYVEAINQNSFGMYDIQHIETVTVQ